MGRVLVNRPRNFHHSNFVSLQSPLRVVFFYWFFLGYGRLSGMSEYGWGRFHPMGGTSKDRHIESATAPISSFIYSGYKYMARGSTKRTQLAKFIASDFKSRPAESFTCTKQDSLYRKRVGWRVQQSTEKQETGKLACERRRIKDRDTKLFSAKRSIMESLVLLCCLTGGNTGHWIPVFLSWSLAAFIRFVELTVILFFRWHVSCQANCRFEWLEIKWDGAQQKSSSAGVGCQGG